MDIWEYKNVSYLADESILNEYGKQGWEAYGALKDGDCVVVLMKRRKTATPNRKNRKKTI